MGLLTGFGSRRVACLDWDTRKLRMVLAVIAKNGVRIGGAAEVPVPADVDVAQAAAFGGFLRSALRSKGMNVDRVIMDVPRQDAVLNPLTLPATADSELASMVRFQVGKELPFSMDQAAVDFAVLRRGEGERGGVDVLVAAIRNHVVEYYKAVAETAGLGIERLGLRPYANAVAITREAAHQTGRVVVIDVGPMMTEIDVIRDGRLVFSRAAAVAVRLPQAAGEAETARPAADHAVIPFREQTERGPSFIDELLVEVTRTLAAYRAADPAATIDRMIVAGSCGIENELSEAMAKRFETPTLIYRPPDDLVRSLGKRAAVEWSGFGAVLGLAWAATQPGTARFDFLHPKEPVNPRHEQMRKVPVIAASVGVVVLAAGTALGLKFHGKARTIAELDEKIKTYQPTVKEIQDLKAKLDAARAWEGSVIVWLDELRIVAEALPPNSEAYLKELRTTEDGTILLKMVATDGKVLEDLVSRLDGLRTDKGAKRYVVVPGDRTPSRDEKYKVQTDIRVRLASLMPKPATQKASSGR